MLDSYKKALPTYIHDYMEYFINQVKDKLHSKQKVYLYFLFYIKNVSLMEMWKCNSCRSSTKTKERVRTICLISVAQSYNEHCKHIILNDFLNNSS